MRGGGCVWILAIAAAAVCADTVTGNDGKTAVKDGEPEQRQRTADLAQTMQQPYGGEHQPRSGQTPAADGYFGDPLGYPQTKRARNKQYGFGLGKRLYRQYEFGLGKRSASKLYGFGLGKRAATVGGQDGWTKWPWSGKRASPTFYSFGLGRRASPQYSFGLGKRVRRDLRLLSAAAATI